MRLVFMLVSDLRCPELFLTYLLQMHNYIVLQCCYAAITYLICLFLGAICLFVPLDGQYRYALLRFAQKLPCQKQ